MKISLFAALSAATIALSPILAPASAQDMPADRGLSTLSSGTYVMDKTHGYVSLSYSHMGYSNPVLHFADVNATVEVKAGDILASTLQVDIDPASVDSSVEKFDDHLKSADFFDVTKHTAITFVSTSLALTTEYSGTLTGDLTIKGITKPVTLAVTLNRAAPHPASGAEHFGIQAFGKIDRSDFDLGAYVPMVGAEVSLRIDAEFGKAK